jgi:hypothetical protein
MSNTMIRDQLVRTICSARMIQTPWAYAYLPKMLTDDALGGLYDTFGNLPVKRSEETRRAKSYRFATARLDPSDDWLPNEEWRWLTGFFHSASYRQAIEQLTGVDLSGSVATVDVWEYGIGDWLAPHVDKQDKLVTQILYLTQSWSEGDGGRLLILENEDASSVARVLRPTLGASAILVRSATSWHAVEPPAPTLPRRRSVTATFWTTGLNGGPAAPNGGQRAQVGIESNTRLVGDLGAREKMQ